MIFKKSNFNLLKITAYSQPITMIGLPHCAVRRFLRFFVLLPIAFALQGCGKEEMVAVSITGYNHIETESILVFSVNGASGPNLAPYSGGGGFSCCVNLPLHWKPGLKATVHWEYGSGPNHTPPPPQSATVDIPEYTPEDMGTLQVHFYPNHKIKVVSTMYGLGHPWHPLPKEDWAPWELDEAVVRNWEWYVEKKQIKRPSGKQ